MVKYTDKNGKEYILRFDLDALKAMEEKYGGYAKAMSEMTSSKSVDMVLEMFTILAQAGADYMAEEQGMKNVEVITADGLLSKHSSPGKLKGIMIAIREAVEDGSRTMTADEDDDTIRDGYLQEIKEQERKEKN